VSETYLRQYSYNISAVYYFSDIRLSNETIYVKKGLGPLINFDGNFI
jgi:hypothetical protein